MLRKRNQRLSFRSLQMCEKFRCACI